MEHPFWEELRCIVGDRAYRVFSLRVAHEWRISRIAEVMGIHRHTVRRMVRRVREASTKLARATGVRRADLFPALAA